MQTDLGDTMLRDLDAFEKELQSWKKSVPRNLVSTMKRAGNRWKQEGRKRVPVQSAEQRGHGQRELLNSLADNVYIEGGTIILEFGSNKEYAAFTEFGTDAIASGRVKAIGTGPEISDAQAVKDWPAKTERATQGIIKEQEQMPWLRPSFMAIRPWLINELDMAVAPPSTGTGGEAAA